MRKTLEEEIIYKIRAYTFYWQRRCITAWSRWNRWRTKARIRDRWRPEEDKHAETSSRLSPDGANDDPDRWTPRGYDATRGNARGFSASNVPRQYGAPRRFEEPALLHLAGPRASVLARIIDRTASAWRSCRRRSQDTMPQSRESERSARNESIAARSMSPPWPSHPTPRRPCK